MDLTARLDATIANTLADNRLVGCVVLVARKGEIIYRGAHGLADREANRAMTEDAIFRLSSVTKPLIAATILALVDAGRIGLTDPVTDHLPGFRPRLADGSAPPITIHHLLTHTSGLPTTSILTDAEQAAGINRWRLGDDAIMERLSALPLLFAPGTGWAYGPSIDVLGHIAGRLVGGRPEDALKRYVTGPLGMADTGFVLADDSRLAAAYADGVDGPELMGDPHTIPNYWGGTTTYDPGRIFDPETFQSGGGGAAGTADDILWLLEALRNGDGVLRPETAALAMKNQTPQLTDASGPGWQFSYLGAWLKDPARAQSPAAIGTNRWAGIYGHNWFIDPDRELTVVSMSNTGLEGSDGQFRTDVRDAIYASLD
ncbi:serine hydrolase domain-containing protein [Devosia sp.]|uniref:serine hydrolase domain-containing protein n=1 Tax=Devosia sp. TaxID=1871048 RepID=UPI003A8FACF9